MIINTYYVHLTWIIKIGFEKYNSIYHNNVNLYKLHLIHIYNIYYKFISNKLINNNNLK